MLKVLWLGMLTFLSYSPTLASVAEKPILGGLGTKFHTPIDPAALGSAIERTFHSPNNRPLDIPPSSPESLWHGGCTWTRTYPVYFET
ncbi:MAG: hypothetical protein GKR90_05045 [Pseudomonadales bacterium]|nr:hypothetical protein [Pseudomonadales bacterium]